jgi:predicted membrane-bound spermidine synthase
MLFLKKWPSSSFRPRRFSFLILTILVFVAGIVTMSLEFSVSRLLIPVFGSSIYTWGSLIGVILAGLSFGYHVGGKLADKKDPSFVKFCSILFSTGLYIIFLPFISPLVLDITASMAATTLENSRYTSLLAAFILLVIPTFLLGIVSPYAVKLATKTLSKLGNTSGNLYSASTVGSIVGTFLTVFVLIPAFEIRYISYCTRFDSNSFITYWSRKKKISLRSCWFCCCYFVAFYFKYIVSGSSTRTTSPTLWHFSI